MGTVNSVCGCFGTTNTLSLTDTNIQPRRHEKRQLSGLSISDSPEEDITIDQDNTDQNIRAKRFGFSSKEFELVQVLVRGSFGKVCLVRRKADDEFFILKVLKTQDIYIKNLLDSTLAENGSLTDIEHPFILHLKDSYRDHSRVYLLTEFCPGGNLSQSIKKDGELDFTTAKIYAAELVLGLEYIHDNLKMIHKDINPENILLASDGHIRITDFGFSKTQVKGIIRSGTPNYHAPEVTSGSNYGPEVDWWSLGCVIYFMLVGQPLFEHQKTSSELDEVFSEDEIQFPDWFFSSLKDLLTKLLNKNPEERLGSRGAQQIKNHAFFGDIDWNAVLNKDIGASTKLSIIEEDISEFQKCAFDRSSIEHALGSKCCRNGEGNEVQEVYLPKAIQEKVVEG